MFERHRCATDQKLRWRPPTTPPLTIRAPRLFATLLAGVPAFAAEQTVTLNVANATCELCGPVVKRALAKVPGVLAVDLSEATDAAIAKVRFDDSRTNVAALITATTNAGYPSNLSQ